MKHRKKPAKTAVTAPYERTPQECAAIEETQRKRQEVPLPTFAMAGFEENKATLRIRHSDDQAATAVLHKALGQPRPEGLDHALLALLNVSSAVMKPTDSGFDTAYNATVQAVAGIAPRDGIESLLALQMAAVHNMTMAHAATAMKATDPVKKDMAEKATNRLARTFAVQLEALKKHRSSSEQRIIVQHINVSDNAQAVVSTTVGNGEE